MIELTLDQELRLIELEVKRLEFLYKSYPKLDKYYPNDPRTEYIGVAHTETSRMLDAFKEKWKVKI